MRCDSCPLCPTAEDDVCPESEGKYGMEHADGMSGCKHPWNWAKKRDKEYCAYLGNMGMDMGLEMTLTEAELKHATDLCKHIIGLDYRNPYHRHGNVYYKPYRNYYAEGLDGNKYLDKLPSSFFSKRRGEYYLFYSLTREGLDWLGRQLNITIWDEED